MFVNERLESIVELINKNGKVEVNELSLIYKVSKDLIRKDLRKLEENGLVEKTYGGAIKKRENAKTITINSRISKDIDVKKNIGRKALQYLKNGDIIFLDVSSTNYIFAKEILKTELELTIVTNMIDIMKIISDSGSQKIKLIGIGGICNSLLNGFVGIPAVEQIERFNIDKCFIGTIGINLNNGSVSTYDIDDGLTKNAAINNSKSKFLITDTSKFKQDGKFKFSNLHKFNGLITEDVLTLKEKEQLGNYKIKIF